MKHLPARNAFTLVEMLVVIAIISILITLLLPAIQAAREAARRLHCTNNMKQIILAIRSYETKYQTLPPGSFSPNLPKWQGWSTLSKVLPYMEEQNTYDHINFSVNAYSEQPPAAYVAVNAPSTYERIQTFLCPSDERATHLEMVEGVEYQVPGCNYGVSKGPMVSLNDENIVNPAINARFYGPFRGAYSVYCTPVAEIRDGLSNTVALLEGLVSTSQSSSLASVERNYVMGCTWPSAGTPICGSGQCSPLFNESNFLAFIADAQYDFAAGTDIRNDAGLFWHWAADHSTLMATLLPPNSKIPDARVGSGNYGEQALMRNARSEHSGGANAAFVDGSVHFVSEDIDGRAWWYAGAIGDGAVIDHEF